MCLMPKTEPWEKARLSGRLTSGYVLEGGDSNDLKELLGLQLVEEQQNNSTRPKGTKIARLHECLADVSETTSPLFMAHDTLSRVQQEQKRALIDLKGFHK